MSKAIICIFGTIALFCLASADLPKCPEADNEGGQALLFPADDCNAYYECANGVPYLLFCSEGLYYDISLKTCNYGRNVNCGARKIPEEIVPYNKE